MSQLLKVPEPLLVEALIGLSDRREDLLRLKVGEMRQAIRMRRYWIRYHRSQKGDNRCWGDDYLVWRFWSGAPKMSVPVPPFEREMQKCRSFFKNRRAEFADTVLDDAILDPARWDADLAEMDEVGFLNELLRLQSLIVVHASAEELTIEDDRMLYRGLPENLPADFRLPPEEEFIGGIKAGSGCPNFWASHLGCSGGCDFHQWGPCVKK